MKRLWFLTKELEVGYIDSLCKCTLCIERGKLEFQLKDDKDEFLDSVTYEDLLNKILYFDFNYFNVKNSQVMANENVKNGLLNYWIASDSNG